MRKMNGRTSRECAKKTRAVRRMPFATLAVLVIAFILASSFGMGVVSAQAGPQNSGAGLTEAHPPRVVDDADLLSPTEERELEARLTQIAEKYKCDVAIVTTNGTEGKGVMAFADDYFDYNGYGMGERDDGILFVIDMESRKFWTTTFEDGARAFTDKGIEYITDKITPYLKDGEYNEAFNLYADLADDFMNQYFNEGEAYDTGNMPPQEMPGLAGLGAVGGGIGLSGLLTAGKASSLKSVRKRRDAGDYVVNGSMNVEYSSDNYLYSTTTRSAKPKESSGGGSSMHTSSSGRSHGGGGGSF